MSESVREVLSSIEWVEEEKKRGRPEGWKKYNMDNVNVFIEGMVKVFEGKNDGVKCSILLSKLKKSFLEGVNTDDDKWPTSLPLPSPVLKKLREKGFTVNFGKGNRVIVKKVGNRG